MTDCEKHEHRMREKREREARRPTKLFNERFWYGIAGIIPICFVITLGALSLGITGNWLYLIGVGSVMVPYITILIPWAEGYTWKEIKEIYLGKR